MTAADSMLPLMFGDAPMDVWVGAEGEPWATFARARRMFEAGSVAGAQACWQGIASRTDLESRHTLQAWHFLRSTGLQPPDVIAAAVLGTVAQVPIDGGHDVLAAYADGSIRYLNHSGAVSVVEPPAPANLAEPIKEWKAVAGRLSGQLESWADPLPELPVGHARVLMLTRSGPRFGQGPYDTLSADPAAGEFLNAAVRVLVAVTQLGGQ